MRSNLRDRARQTDTDDDQTDGRHWLVTALIGYAPVTIATILVMGVSIGANIRVDTDRSLVSVLETWNSVVANATGVEQAVLRVVDPVMELAFWAGWELVGVLPVWTVSLLLVALTVGVLFFFALPIAEPLVWSFKAAVKRFRGDTT